MVHCDFLNSVPMQNRLEIELGIPDFKCELTMVNFIVVPFNGAGAAIR